jgi:hypothetical protein
MSDTKISALPAASTPLTGTEVVPLNQSGVTSNVTVANLTAGRNVYANNFIPSVTTTTASATPINLTVSSTQYQIVNGTTTSQQFNLPDATTLSVGDTYYFNNNLTVSSVQVNAHDGSTSVLSLQSGGDAQVVLLNNSTTNGTWDVHSFIPSSASWGTATLSFNNTTSISGNVSWTGTTIGTAYGGTGLTSLTSGYIPYGNGTSAFSSSANLTFNGTNLSVTGTGAFSSNINAGTSGVTSARIVSTAGSTSQNGYQSNLPNSTTSVGYQSSSVTSASTNWYHFVGQSGNGSGITTNNIFIYGNGNIQNTNNSYGALSDAKLKQNITLSDSQWNDVKALGQLIKKYSLIADETNTLQIGWVAQDVQTISPKLVFSTLDKDMEGNDLGTETLGINYSIAYMKAFKALSEAMIRIEQLEARLTAANIG